MSTEPSTRCSLSTASSANLAPVTASAASCAVETPRDFIVTAPLDTEKSLELNDAIPLFDVVASSPEIVTVLSVTAVSIPSPPVNVNVSLIRETVSVPESPALRYQSPTQQSRSRNS